MSNQRFQALIAALAHQPLAVNYPDSRSSAYYGSKVFGEKVILSYIPKEVWEAFREDVAEGRQPQKAVIDQIATAMKDWAMSKGATHYTHWFQPLTGTTAEKHDAFLTLENGQPMDLFSGHQLIRQEPDASSFPSGGIRTTFEARGYTAWDPGSPAFVRGHTLCVPSVYVSYTGDALDNKTPLLRALNTLDQAATTVAQLFDEKVTAVRATLGWEQEYFLADTSLYHARPDLVLTGRTVFGHSAAKNQQLEDHYFGVIPERVEAFMRDFEIEAMELGIPVKTRHNEVAPNQFECAPIFEEVNTAIDHNQLVMDVIQRVARRHNYEALLHEKPFAGVNGSGKHNNWSMMTNLGDNLLSPGKNSQENFRFLTFLINIVAAVHNHAPLLRASIASASNELRLGAHEAPPAIISVFIGSYLTQMLDEFCKAENMAGFFPNNHADKSLKLQKIPEILLDNTDRNRTSPFAFTGNKFEFRAVGSSANCSAPMTTLTTIVAYQLNQFLLEVKNAEVNGKGREEAIFMVLKRMLEHARPVLFEGNNYSDEWVREAEKRGLPNIPSTPEALKAIISDDARAVFTRTGVLTDTELHARHEIELENYIKKIQIEGRVIGDLAINHIIPVAVKYQNILIKNARGLKELFQSEPFHQMAAPILQTIEDISEHMFHIHEGVAQMTEARRSANQQKTIAEKAFAYHDNVLPWFQRIRDHVDSLELLVDDELWPLPKYRELLFTH